jgi:NCS1 family nucleobase:cation symporter-1
LIDWRLRKTPLDQRSLAALLSYKNLQTGWPALVALLAGFGAMVPFMNTSLVVGPLAHAMDGADISFFVGFPVTAALYYCLRRAGTKRQAAHGQVDRWEPAPIV